MKPDCYECVYRGNVQGSYHSSCNHPAFEQLAKDPMAQLLGIFAQVGRVAPIQGVSTEIIVKGNKHGIQNGWFNHPFNFDPLWLEECELPHAKAVRLSLPLDPTIVAATWSYLNPITFWQKLMMLVIAIIEFVAIFGVEVAILR